MQSPEGTISERSGTSSPDRFTYTDLKGRTMAQVYDGRLPRTMFESETIVSTISSIRNTVETSLILGGTMFEHVESPFATRGRANDRATNSIHDPLEEVKTQFDQLFKDIEHYSGGAKYMKEITIPSIKRIISCKDSTGEQKCARSVRRALNGNVRLNNYYVNHFDDFLTWLGQPMSDLRDLADLLLLIIQEGNGETAVVAVSSNTTDNIASPASEQGKGETTTTSIEHGKSEALTMHGNDQVKTESSSGKCPSEGIKAKTPATHGHPIVQKKNKATRDKDDNEFGFKLKGWALNDKFDLDGKEEKKTATTKPAGKEKVKERSIPLIPTKENVQALLQKYTFPKLSTPAEEENTVAKDDDYVKQTLLLKAKADAAKNPGAPETPFMKEERMKADPATPKWKKQLADKHRIYNLYASPLEMQVFSKALNTACAALKKGEECAKLIVERQCFAEEMRDVYQAYELECEEMANEYGERLEMEGDEENRGRRGFH